MIVKYLNGTTKELTDLRGANLQDANLQDADLWGANLRDANLQNTLGLEQTVIVPEGKLTVYKKCLGGVIVTLKIPAKARRSNATTRKCRAEYADVVAISGGRKETSSLHDLSFIYRVGERVTCDTWDPDRWNECGGGIHFFLTEEEAINY